MRKTLRRNLAQRTLSENQHICVCQRRMTIQHPDLNRCRLRHSTAHLWWRRKPA